MDTNQKISFTRDSCSPDVLVYWEHMTTNESGQCKVYLYDTELKLLVSFFKFLYPERNVTRIIRL